MCTATCVWGFIGIYQSVAPWSKTPYNGLTSPITSHDDVLVFTGLQDKGELEAGDSGSVCWRREDGLKITYSNNYILKSIFPLFLDRRRYRSVPQQVRRNSMCFAVSITPSSLSTCLFALQWLPAKDCRLAFPFAECPDHQNWYQLRSLNVALRQRMPIEILVAIIWLRIDLTRGLTTLCGIINIDSEHKSGRPTSPKNEW